MLFTLTCNSVEVHGTAAQKTVLQDISISLLTSFCSKMGWLVWLVQIFPLAESFGHWITVTGEEPPSAWLFQRKIYRSTFGSNFKNVLKPAIYPQQSRSANGGEPQFSGGTIALMAAHLGQRSSSSLLSGLDVSRLEPHRLGLSPTRILASPIIGLSSTDWPVSRPFTRSPRQREGAEQDFQPLKSDW